MGQVIQCLERLRVPEDNLTKTRPVQRTVRQQDAVSKSLHRCRQHRMSGEHYLSGDDIGIHQCSSLADKQ